MAGAILITGAGGFVGRHLLDQLAEDDGELIAWHRPDSRPPDAVPSAKWQAVDLLDPRAVDEAIRLTRPSAIYHCAGAAHVGRSWDATESTFAVNVRGTHYLLEAIRRAALDTRVLIPSSAMVYRPAAEPLTEDHAVLPPNPYGLSKLAQELLGLRTSNDRVQMKIGRAFNHIGPRQDPSFAGSGFAKQIAEIEMGLRDAEVVVGNLDARRDILDVRDTVRAYRTILERGRTSRVYNVSSGRALVVGDLLEQLRSRARSTIRVRVDPSRFRPNDVPVLVGDSSRIFNELGWTPTIPLAKTLDDLLSYWRSAIREIRHDS